MESSSKLAEIRVGKLAINIAGTLLTVVFCVLGVWLARRFPGHVPFAEKHALLLLVMFLLLVPVHEALHAFGLRIFAGVPWRHIRFGIMWSALVPYCHCTVPITVHAYRRMALLPLWVTGSIPVVSLFAFPSDWLGAFAGMAVAACVGDVWLVARLRPFTGASLVQDSRSEIGCDVFSADSGNVVS